MIRGVSLVFLVFGVAACGDDGKGPDPDPDPMAIACTDDTETVTVTVGAGLQPIFNWDPACAVALLLVEAGGGDVWLISTDEATWDNPAQANLIAPPITYGVAPTSVPELQAPDPLASGVSYEVILWRALASGSTVSAIHEFRALSARPTPFGGRSSDRSEPAAPTPHSGPTVSPAHPPP